MCWKMLSNSSKQGGVFISEISSAALFSSCKLNIWMFKSWMLTACSPYSYTSSSFWSLVTLYGTIWVCFAASPTFDMAHLDRTYKTYFSWNLHDNQISYWNIVFYPNVQTFAQPKGKWAKLCFSFTYFFNKMTLFVCHRF